MSGQLGYQVYLDGLGWKQGFVYDGMVTGTAGIDLPISAVQVTGLPNGVQYQAKMSDGTMTPWVSEGETAGASFPDEYQPGVAMPAIWSLSFQDSQNSGAQIWGRIYTRDTSWTPARTLMSDNPFGLSTLTLGVEAIQLFLAVRDNSQGQDEIESNKTSTDQAEGVPSGQNQAGTPTPNEIASALALQIDGPECLASLGGIMVNCAATDFLDCNFGDTKMILACVQMVTELGDLIPGQETVAPAPSQDTIGPENPPPPDWVPGGNTMPKPEPKPIVAPTPVPATPSHGVQFGPIHEPGGGGGGGGGGGDGTLRVRRTPEPIVTVTESD